MNTDKYMLWALLFFPIQMISGSVWAESTKKDKSSTGFISHARDKELPNSLYRDLLDRDGLHSQLGDTTVIVPVKAYADKDNILSLHYQVRQADQISQSVSHFDLSQQKNIGGTNRFNNLAGQVPGLVITQRGSMPGNEWSQILVRGLHSFGIGQTSPLILLDGVETDIDHIDPYAIESITVLKDASATAMFGFRAAGGVILLQSRRGKEGPISVEFNSQGSIVQPMRTPSFLGAFDYARLHNEASLNEGGSPRYSESDLEGYRSGSDPFQYPDINWVDEYLLDHSYQTRNNVVISAGEDNRTYFFSLGHVHNTGLFNVDDQINPYQTNSNFNSTNFQTSVTYQATPRLFASVDFRARLATRRTPGAYFGFEDRFFSNLYNTPPLATPVHNPDGSLAGTQDYRHNLFGELNHAGYSVWKRTLSSGVINVAYDLADLRDGLMLTGRFGYISNANHITNRSKEYAVFQYFDLDSINQIGQNTNMSNSSQYGQDIKYHTGELGLHYQTKLAGNDLRSGLFLDRHQQTWRNTNLPRIYQSVKGFTSYNIDQRYVFDLAFSYMGSEQFPPGQRYGLFPSLSAAWIISNEAFMDQLSVFSYLRLRSSYGIVGNDFDPYDSNTPYFGFLDNFSTGMGRNFGYNASWEQGFFESNAANHAITWEKVAKFNIGLDGRFFDDHLFAGVDYFSQRSSDIMVLGANPAITGYSFWLPSGISDNQGVEATLGYYANQRPFRYYISGNVLLAKNKVIEQGEPPLEYEWMQRTGHPIGSMFGYTFDRFLTEDDNMEDLPDHSFLGELHPGDMLYKDLNGDGLIDERDVSFIAHSNVPRTYYGINAGFSYRGFDMNVLLQGSRGGQTLFRNPFMFEFWDGKGNVQDMHLERWTPGSDQTAGYPRLSIATGEVNRVNSTYWIRQINYLRIKTAELGYTFESPFRDSANITSFRIYVSGFNLFTWDDIHVVDPEYRAWGNFYPMTRYFSAGVNLVF